MSTRIMSLCWPLKMPPSSKAVLISLADNANDEGHCWPSIDTVCERTCLSRRTVIDSIKALESAGFLKTVRASGRANSYQIAVDQCSRRTSAAVAPVQQPHGTSATVARDPCSSRTGPVQLSHPNRKEPSKNRQRTEDAGVAPRPDSVPETVWSDFVAARKAKRAPLTRTALAGIEREAEKAGLTLSAALAMCCERGWQGFQASWLREPGNSARASPQSGRAAVVAQLTGRANPPEIVDVEPVTTAIR